MYPSKENNINKLFQPLVALHKPLLDFTLITSLLKPISMPFIQSSELLKKTYEPFEIMRKFAEQQRDFQEFVKLFNSIVIELEQRNIDTEVIGELEFSEIFKLYHLSNRTGLTFADLAEDSLNMFGEIKYEQAVAYLQAINKRIKKIVKNELINFDSKDDLNEDLNALEETEKTAVCYIKLKIKEYADGKIKLSPKEKTLLAAFKKNKFLSNSDLAQMFGYSDRNIENICATIRQKFAMDFTEDNLKKRILLTSLARYITL